MLNIQRALSAVWLIWNSDAESKREDGNSDCDTTGGTRQETDGKGADQDVYAAIKWANGEG